MLGCKPDGANNLMRDGGAGTRRLTHPDFGGRRFQKSRIVEQHGLIDRIRG